LAARSLASLVAVAALASSTPALSQIIFGQAKAVDGDTLLLGETYIRLHGVDAVEASQHCTRGGADWACGAEAERYLGNLISGGSVQCQQRDRDSYGRVVATCKAKGRDLSEQMAQAGFAVALPQYSKQYVWVVEEAQTRRAGIWAGEFQEPADYRAANPQPLLPPPSRPRQRSSGPPQVVQQFNQPQRSTYYRNCAAARSAGAAPLRRGAPGYRPELDADSDGVACEPYRGR